MAGSNDMRKFGTELALDGEKEFKKAISGINTDLTVLGSELGKIGAQFGKNADSLESLTAKQTVYNKQIDLQKEKVSDLRAALEKSAKEFGENDKATKNWQIALNKAEGDLARTENSLKETTSQIDEFGKESTDTGKKVEVAGEKARKSGTDAEKGESGWNKLGAGMTKAGIAAGKAFAALGAAVGVAAGAAAVGTYKMVMSSTEAADKVQTLADVTGFSAETIQELQYAGTKLDVELETITGSQTKLIKAMSAAQGGTKAQVEAFKDLGISVTDANGNLRDSKDVMFEAFGALGKIGNETERDAISMKVFGKSARELNPLIKAGAGELKKLTAEARTNGSVLSNEQVAALDSFGDSVEAFKLQVKGLGSSISVGLLPMFDDALAGLQDLSGAVGKAVKSGDWSQVGTAVSEGLNGIVGQISSGMPIFTGMAATVIGGLAGALATSIPDVLPSLVDATLELLDTIVQVFDDNGPMLVDTGLKALMSVIDGLGKELPRIIDVGLKIITKLINGISDSLPRMVPTIIGIIANVVATLVSNMDKMVPAAIKLIIALGNGIIASLPILVSKIPQITAAIVKTITDNLPQLIESGAEMIGNMAAGVGGAMPEIMTSIGLIIDAILDAFAKVNWLKVGGSIIKGIAKGIDSGRQSFLDSVDAGTNPWAIKNGLSQSAKKVSGSSATAPTSLPQSSLIVKAPDIYLNGKILSSSNSYYQSSQNQSYSRALGYPVGR